MYQRKGAHRGALCEGPTVSVSAGGVDRLYPVGNAGVLEAVIANGALVAEVPPGCQPGRHRFVSRNRVIAAISGATIVVEAAWRSGALSTAHRALDMGRPVGAVPGPVTSMSSVGRHRPLRKGAGCIIRRRWCSPRCHCARRCWLTVLPVHRPLFAVSFSFAV